MEEEFYDIRVWFRRAAETYPEYGDVAERRNAYTDVVGGVLRRLQKGYALNL
jgi:hypothetical protein